MIINQEEVIIDACCVINLYSTLVFREILESLPSKFYISKYVKEDEALKIKKSLDNLHQYISIDLVPFIKSGVIKEMELEGKNEISTFVNFAANIDDGEAICGSLAFHRGLQVATDDKAAINLFKSQPTPIPTLSTLELLKSWAQMQSVEPDIIREALKNIELRACYIPNQNHEHYNWWKKHRHG